MCLNAGKFYSIMKVLPHVSATAFMGLQRLFDLYFFTVVTSFVPQTALQALFSHFESQDVVDGGGGARPGSTVSSPTDDADAYTYRDPMCTCSPMQS